MLLSLNVIQNNFIDFCSSFQMVLTDFNFQIFNFLSLSIKSLEFQWVLYGENKLNKKFVLL